MIRFKTSQIRSLILFLFLSLVLVSKAQFVHPGGLHTIEDLDRMKAKVNGKVYPWVNGYNLMIADYRASNTYKANPHFTVGTPYRQTAQKDAMSAYYNTLRWYITGDTTYAECAVRILNAWSDSVKTVVTGELFMLPIPSFVQTGELLRIYPGWKAADFTRFKNMCSNYFYPACHNFIGYCGSWPGWDGPAIASILQIGVLCDDTAKFNEGVRYYKFGAGGGCILNNVCKPNGQLSEMGRDIPHAEIGPAYMADMCQVAWNQGVDLFGYADNRLLAGFEYFCKFNLNHPIDWEYDTSNCVLSQNHFYYPAQNQYPYRIYGEPIFEMIYNHYVEKKGLKAPYTRAMINLRGLVGTTSELNAGYVGLTYTLSDTTTVFKSRPISSPTNLTATAGVSNVVLNWTAATGDVAQGYMVLRGKTAGGPYGQIASWTDNTTTQYIDTTAVIGTTYYYSVKARNQSGISGSTNEVSASPVAASTTLPTDWSRKDIGTVAAAGSLTYANVQNNTFIIKGSGAGMGGTTDNCSYAYTRVTGDNSITARLYKPVLGGYDADRIGVMIRDSLIAGSRAVFLGISDKDFRHTWFTTRSTLNNSVAWIAGDTHTWTPTWFRIKAKSFTSPIAGYKFIGYQSIDGVVWTAVDSSTIYSFSKINNIFTKKYYVGVYASSGSSTASQIATVTFDNVSVTSGTISGVQQAWDSGLEIYPNPVKNELHINFSNSSGAKVDIYSISGIKVYSDYLNVQNNVVGVAGLNPGIYFVQLNDGQKIHTTKIVKNGN